MMLLRTLVLERNHEGAPVNGALLCGFAVAQTASNFLAYSLDEEAEPGHSRVYISVLRKKLERYFLGGVDSKEDLRIAMQVFKQILTLAAGSDSRTSSDAESQVPFHFIDLKGCRLPAARPEDHHSVIIKKALVMKVITLGMSAPSSPAIESNTVIVPSIRFSSQMVSPPPNPSHLQIAPQPVNEDTVEEPVQSFVELPDEPHTLPLEVEHSKIALPKDPAPLEQGALLEMDSTLSNLAKVAHELTQKKRAVLEKEEVLEQWQIRLQQQQNQLDEKHRELELLHTHLKDQQSDVSQRAEKLTMMMSQLSGMRQHLQGTLLGLDQLLDGHG